ncbi:MAG: VanZ family protein [Firmicutes bacterium]|nr:VanZ family protein [Bacillota bacterium]
MHSFPKSSIKAARLLFILYLLILLYILFLTQNRSDTFGEYNLIPFRNILMFFRYYFVYHEFTFLEWFENIFGNILLLVPFGVLLPFVCGRRMPLVLIVLLAALFSIVVEAVQYFSGLGELDIDDVLLNLFGGFIGGSIACRAERAVSRLLDRCAKLFSLTNDPD